MYCCIAARASLTNSTSFFKHEDKGNAGLCWIESLMAQNFVQLLSASFNITQQGGQTRTAC